MEYNEHNNTHEAPPAKPKHAYYQKGHDRSYKSVEHVSTLDPPPERADEETPANEAEWVTLNVGGQVFLTKRTTLLRIPNTVLANLAQDCPHFHTPTGQFLFDRNPYYFQYVLDFYRTGQLHFPHNLCGPSIQKELVYWGIDENHIQGCCWNNYKDYGEQEETLATLGTAFNVIDKFDPNETKTNVLLSYVHKVRKAIWYFLEDPKSSALAQLWALLYILMILASVLSLAFNTHKAFRIPSPVDRSTPNETNTKKLLLDTTNPHDGLFYTELVISSIFAADLITRFIVCPRKIPFLKSKLNWLDTTVVVSQWATFAITRLPNFWQERRLQTAYQFFSLLRICRVFLVFKLARHYTGLRILLLALKASFKEMMLLCVFMIIGMIIFSTLIYYAELDTPDVFQDIPTGFWWAIVTMTTVGYGDVHPVTGPGYVVGSICAICGMLATGLPIPIIANNFTFFYNVSKLKRRMDEKTSVKLSTDVLYTVKSFLPNPFSKNKKLAVEGNPSVVSSDESSNVSKSEANQKSI